MRKTEFGSSFSKSTRQVKIAIILIIGLFALIAITNLVVLSGSTGFKAIITTGYGEHSETFYVKEWHESNGCIDFTDAFGRTHHVCGQYSLTLTK